MVGRTVGQDQFCRPGQFLRSAAPHHPGFGSSRRVIDPVDVGEIIVRAGNGRAPGHHAAPIVVPVAQINSPSGMAGALPCASTLSQALTNSADPGPIDLLPQIDVMRVNSVLSMGSKQTQVVRYGR